MVILLLVYRRGGLPFRRTAHNIGREQRREPGAGLTPATCVNEDIVLASDAARNLRSPAEALLGTGLTAECIAR
jgi:hypothetical protein